MLKFGWPSQSGNRAGDGLEPDSECKMRHSEQAWMPTRVASASEGVQSAMVATQQIHTLSAERLTPVAQAPALAAASTG